MLSIIGYISLITGAVLLVLGIAIFFLTGCVGAIKNLSITKYKAPTEVFYATAADDIFYNEKVEKIERSNKPKKPVFKREEPEQVVEPPKAEKKKKPMHNSFLEGRKKGNRMQVAYQDMNNDFNVESTMPLMSEAIKQNYQMENTMPLGSIRSEACMEDTAPLGSVVSKAYTDNTPLGSVAPEIFTENTAPLRGADLEVTAENTAPLMDMHAKQSMRKGYKPLTENSASENTAPLIEDMLDGTMPLENPETKNSDTPENAKKVNPRQKTTTAHPLSQNIASENTSPLEATEPLDIFDTAPLKESDIWDSDSTMPLEISQGKLRGEK